MPTLLPGKSVFLTLYQKNRDQRADQQQIRIEQIPHDGERRQGKAHFRCRRDGDQHLRTIGDNALKNAGEGVQQAGRAGGGDAVILAHFLGNGVCP